jgi:hypothetical protein
MSAEDIRWKQRFYNFLKAYSQLEEGVKLTNQRSLTKLENQGLIQAFEFTHELAWNTLSQIVSSILNTYFTEFKTF